MWQRSKCQTCGQALKECAGHFGYVKLALPVFHIGYFKATLELLHNICKTCSKVLLDEDTLRRLSHKMRDPTVGALQKVKIRKVITEKCRKVRCCPHCGAYNGRVKIVKNASSLKFIHERCVVRPLLAGEIARSPVLGHVRLFQCTASRAPLSVPGTATRRTADCASHTRRTLATRWRPTRT